MYLFISYRSNTNFYFSVRELTHTSYVNVLHVKDAISKLIHETHTTGDIIRFLFLKIPCLLYLVIEISCSGTLTN